MKKTYNNKKIATGTAALLLAIPTITNAAALDEEDWDSWPVVSNQTLDSMRGGFISHTGMLISFGIEKAVFVDGTLQTVSSISIPQLQEIINGRVDLLQSGSGNAAAGNLPNSLTTFIQNTLDKVTLQNLTVINASITGLELARMMRLGATLQQQLVESLK